MGSESYLKSILVASVTLENWTDFPQTYWTLPIELSKNDFHVKQWHSSQH
jgi:hypothetical protein